MTNVPMAYVGEPTIPAGMTANDFRLTLRTPRKGPRAALIRYLERRHA